VVRLGSNPLSSDSDNDGLTDLQEYSLGTSITEADGDGDGVSDYWEILLGSDPRTGHAWGAAGVLLSSRLGMFIVLLFVAVGFLLGGWRRYQMGRIAYAKTPDKIRFVTKILEEAKGDEESIRDVSIVYPDLSRPHEPLESLYDSIIEVVTADYERELQEIGSSPKERKPLNELYSRFEEAIMAEIVSLEIEQELEEPTADVSMRPMLTESAEDVEILRGCEVVGGVFEYKVKVQNESDVVITDVTVSIVAYPDDALEITGEKSKIISRIDVGGFRSPQFIFVPTKDCVEGKILAQVSYIDHQGKLHTREVRPYVIKSVCDLLNPMEVKPNDFDFIIGGMKETSEKKEVEWNSEVLLLKTNRLLKAKNFHIVDSEMETVGGRAHALVRAIAKGKYTKKRVAVLIEIIGPVDGSKSTITVEALGDDLAMLPTTIDEVTDGMDSWICLSCGAQLTSSSVGLLRSGLVIECPYCAAEIKAESYQKHEV
ncbi:MAG: thrombospondin type 3 repeat-containing protein, partial [Candidatus Thorarchaeota archaeon]